MNPVDSVAKRQQSHESELASLSYERFLLCRQIDASQGRIAQIDNLIAGLEASIKECEQAKRDFGTYMAIEAAGEGKQEPETQ